MASNLIFNEAKNQHPQGIKSVDKFLQKMTRLLEKELGVLSIEPYMPTIKYLADKVLKKIIIKKDKKKICM